jgi:hypothetical protein
MDQDPLVREQIDAGKRFLDEFEKYAPVHAAFWLKTSDDSDWYLYVASDQISDQNFDVAYGEVLRLAGEIQDPNFDAFRVKLIGGDNPLARAALDIHQRHPAKVPTWFNGKNFGGMSVERVYIYPTKVVAPPKFSTGE